MAGQRSRYLNGLARANPKISLPLFYMCLVFQCFEIPTADDHGLDYVPTLVATGPRFHTMENPTMLALKSSPRSHTLAAGMRTLLRAIQQPGRKVLIRFRQLRNVI